jgi:hypothetical protein
VFSSSAAGFAFYCNYVDATSGLKKR